MNKLNIILLMMAISFCTYTNSQTILNKNNKKTPAESLWSAMPQQPIYQTQADSNNVEYYMKVEDIRLNYWNAGKIFWQRFPTDPRRFEWFSITVRYPPYFWVDKKRGAEFLYMYSKNRNVLSMDSSVYVNRNNDSLLSWKKSYNRYKTDCFNSIQFSPKERFYFLTSEIESHFEALRISKEKRIILNNLQKTFKQAFEIVTKNKIARRDSFALLQSIDIIFRLPKLYGLRTNDLAEFLSLFDNDTNKELHQWYRQKKTVLGLDQTPADISLKGLNDLEINIEKLKGKVILMDFWSTLCTSCVERMPAIDTVYKKYHEKGFEVISICLDPENNMDKVLKIINKLNLSWPVAVIGGKYWGDSDSIWKKINKKFGLIGVPQYLLLNKQGIIVMYNDELERGDIDSLVMKLLHDQ